MRLRTALACVCLAALGACRPDTVDLAYRYPAGAQTTYRLIAEASARWDIGGPGRGSYRATFDVTERVVESDGSGATLEVEMLERDVEESGLPSPGTRLRTFTLRVGPNGEVEEVVDVDGIPARSLEPDQLVFVGTYRPPLPSEPVRLDDGWRTQQESALAAAFREIVTDGRLDGFSVSASEELARLIYSSEGPLSATTQLPQGAVALTGSITTTGNALFDIERGFLESAHSATTGNFDVRVVVSAGEAPITGTMQLRLDLEVERS